MCSLFRGSTVHKEEDNLSIVDKNPNVFFIRRFHSTQGRGQPLYSGLVPMCPLFGGSTGYLNTELRPEAIATRLH